MERGSRGDSTNKYYLYPVEIFINVCCFQETQVVTSDDDYARSSHTHGLNPLSRALGPFRRHRFEEFSSRDVYSTLWGSESVVQNFTLSPMDKFDFRDVYISVLKGPEIYNISEKIYVHIECVYLLI